MQAGRTDGRTNERTNRPKKRKDNSQRCFAAYKTVYFTPAAPFFCIFLVLLFFHLVGKAKFPIRFPKCYAHPTKVAVAYSMKRNPTWYTRAICKFDSRAASGCCASLRSSIALVARRQQLLTLSHYLLAIPFKKKVGGYWAAHSFEIIPTTLWNSI